MRLYLVRHAVAVPRGAPGYADDTLRPLTTDGHQQAERIGRALHRLDVRLGVILTSPYVRARQTAAHVADAVPGVPVRELRELRAEADPDETSQALRAWSDESAVACVGHEPHLGAWLAWLVTGSGGLQCRFKKGGVACVELSRMPPAQGRGTLYWLLTPKQLALMARSRQRGSP